jgi:glycosyltransferase involved in cell wall biosynthesis
MNQAVQRVLKPVRPLKVLSISHSAMRESSERLRYAPLAQAGDIQLTLLVPEKWKQFGYQWIAEPSPSSLDVRIHPIRLGKMGRAKWYMHYYPGLERLVDQLRPDVIHLWEEPWSVVALQAARLCQRRTPRPALVLETEQNILYKLPLPFEKIRRYTLSCADAMVVRQEEALAVCRACGYEGKGVVVEYWADTNRFFPHDRAGARKEFGSRGFTVGYVGRMVEDKGLFTVLDALSLCKEDIHFFLAGDGPDRDRIIRRAHELGLTNRVRIFPKMAPERVAHFMNALDVLVLMSVTTRTWKEQFGRVAMEVQACRVPVVGSSSGAIPSVVGEGGWIVTEYDSLGLSLLLDRLANDPDEVNAKADAALKQARSRFSVERISDALRAAFLEGSRNRQSKVTSEGSV